MRESNRLNVKAIEAAIGGAKKTGKRVTLIACFRLCADANYPAARHAF